MPVLEIGYFEASEALLADPELARKPFEAAAKADGCIKVYYGIDVDQGKRAFMVAIWESFDHYKKLTESAEFPALVEAIKPAVAGPLQAIHAEVKTDPTIALEAPFTEVTIVTLKEGRTFEEIKPLGEALDSNSHLAKGTHIPSSWGSVIQDRKKVGVVVGWDSVEQHAALPGTPPFNKIFAEMAEMADLTSNHVKFTRVVV